MTSLAEYPIHDEVRSFLNGGPKKLLIDGAWVDAVSGRTFRPTTLPPPIRWSRWRTRNNKMWIVPCGRIAARSTRVRGSG